MEIKTKCLITQTYICRQLIVVSDIGTDYQTSHWTSLLLNNKKANKMKCLITAYHIYRQFIVASDIGIDYPTWHCTPLPPNNKTAIIQNV